MGHQSHTPKPPDPGPAGHQTHLPHHAWKKSIEIGGIGAPWKHEARNDFFIPKKVRQWSFHLSTEDSPQFEYMLAR